MKIILGSDLSFLLKYGYAQTGIPKDQMKIGYVTTAAKGSRNETYIERHESVMKENGYDFEEIDIETKSLEELKRFFKDKNVIQVEGGNTFYLLKAIKEASFDKMLAELLGQGKVFIGTSAGAYIMCPSIEVSDWNDDGRERFGVTDFTALNYVPFVLKVHYKDEMEEMVRGKIKNLKYPLRILKDGQGILIDGDTIKFVGDEKETIL